MRAGPEIAIDSVPIIAVTCEERLRADDDVTLQIRWRNFVRGPCKHVTQHGPRLAGARSIRLTRDALRRVIGGRRLRRNLSGLGGRPALTGFLLWCRRRWRLGGGAGRARAHT